MHRVSLTNLEADHYHQLLMLKSERFSLVSVLATLLAWHTPRYARQGCAVDQCDRGIQTVQDSVPATPVDRVLVRKRAGFRHVRCLLSRVGERRLGEYARLALDVTPLRPVELHRSELVTGWLGLHQQFTGLGGFLLVVLKEGRVLSTSLSPGLITSTVTESRCY